MTTRTVSQSPRTAKGGQLRNLVRRPARFVRKSILPSIMPGSSHARPGSVDPVRVVGMLSSSSGLGMSSRLCADALLAAGMSVSTRDVARLFAEADGLEYPAGQYDPEKRAAISIYHLNPPKLLPGLINSNLLTYYRTYNIGYWAWELGTLPKEWTDAFRFVDAVMVPSTFCRDVMRRYTDKPVMVVPHPVSKPRETNAATREPSDTFQVLSIFSYGSSLNRKNPLSLVKAFRLAVGDSSEARLQIKTSSARSYPDDHRTLCEAVAGFDNIEVVDELWSEAQLAEAFVRADAYASLHRSEGFGLTLAEAIMAEVPVVATNWSGNTDFCQPDLIYPVDYSLVPFVDHHPDFEGVGNASWAEPSVEHAAEQLRRVRAQPEEARRKAAASKAALIDFLARNTYANALSALVGRDEEVAA